MGVRRLLIALIVLITAVALIGCGRQPTLQASQVDEIRLKRLSPDDAEYVFIRTASATETARFIAAYRRARNLPEDFDAPTMPASADIVLSSGELIRVWGGVDRVQTVGWAGRQYNIESDELSKILAAVANERAAEWAASVSGRRA